MLIHQSFSELLFIITEFVLVKVKLVIGRDIGRSEFL